MVVVACNTATSVALPDLQGELEVPVVSVIVPEAHAAVQATRNRRIGLLATELTVASGRYESLVRTLDAGARLTSVPCPKFVPLIANAVVDVPVFIVVGLMLVIVGGPADALFTVDVVCAVLFPVFVSPVTVLAVAVKVCEPVADGVQPKFTD